MINYRILADVVDIRSDTPHPEDHLLVDTNAWYWLTYSKASLYSTSPRPYQVKNYPNYIKQALTVRATLHHSGLSLPELASLIENVELELLSIKTTIAHKKKEARHNDPAFRANVVAEVEAAWMQVEGMSGLAPLSIDASTIKNAIGRLRITKLDGYDLFTAETNLANPKLYVLTDDGDFSSLPGVVVFTSNSAVLSAAKAQGRLITR